MATFFFATLTHPKTNAITKLDVPKNGILVLGGNIDYGGELTTNAKQVICRQNFITKIHASEAILVDCVYNPITVIFAPKAIYIDCKSTSVEHLNLPIAKYIRCQYTPMATIDAPNAVIIDARNAGLLKKVNAPKATVFR